MRKKESKKRQWSENKAFLFLFPLFLNIDNFLVALGPLGPYVTSGMSQNNILGYITCLPIFSYTPQPINNDKFHAAGSTSLHKR